MGDDQYRDLAARAQRASGSAFTKRSPRCGDRRACGGDERVGYGWEGMCTTTVGGLAVMHDGWRNTGRVHVRGREGYRCRGGIAVVLRRKSHVRIEKIDSLSERRREMMSGRRKSRKSKFIGE